MTSPTGRIVPFEMLQRQLINGQEQMRRMREAALGAGAKEVGVDSFIISGDYAALEKRIMEAMREPDVRVRRFAENKGG